MIRAERLTGWTDEAVQADLRSFPRPWLLACLEGLEVREGRRRALDFMLGRRYDPAPQPPVVGAPAGTVTSLDAAGQTVVLPVDDGLLPGVPMEMLATRLADTLVAREYTRRALAVAPWPVLRAFSRDWLLSCLEGLELRDGRRRALDVMLGSRR